MLEIKDKGLNIELQIKAIEILNSSIKLPPHQNKPFTDFNFNVGIESRVDGLNKNISVIVHVDVKNIDQSLVLGNLSVSSVYEIGNFAEVIKMDDGGKIQIPQSLIEVLNSISISTTRGVMFSTFRGTFLHGAVLPIIDPKQFRAN